MNVGHSDVQEVLRAVFSSREILYTQMKGQVKMHRVNWKLRQKIEMCCKLTKFRLSSTYRV